MEAAKRLQSRYDSYLGFEEIESGDDGEKRAEFPCLFCGEVFDFVGLCCHIDGEHPIESKNGVCPVCAARVGMDLVGHMTTQHRNYYKMQHRRRFRKAPSGSQSLLSLLRKDLRDGNLRSLIRGSTYLSAPHTVAPDPFLSSLIYTLPVAESSKDVQTETSHNQIEANNRLNMKLVDRTEKSLSDKDQRERAQRSGFVQELVLSTLLDDGL
ncbi:protein DEHYDRATION-INDUCED 19 homolog 2-like isoform X2 [Ananas comosus]|uniref:Protein DEHYDRATION-INDUCED 19 homolog 2-like isoform X2 n=1 Tax=Ananas comosus TaxID=4615 RepID=A0A6P5GGM0_ANACO|nr:protein DEHYDRATION-INDUCED 19 homolog 2-like isoform X2 [Ananas comosus]